MQGTCNTGKNCCGIDLSDIEDQGYLPEKVFTANFPGENVLGFIIMYVTARNRAKADGLLSTLEEEIKDDVPNGYRDEYYSFLQTLDKYYKEKKQNNDLQMHRTLDLSNAGLQYLRKIDDSLTSAEKLSNFSSGLCQVITCIMAKKVFSF